LSISSDCKARKVCTYAFAFDTSKVARRSGLVLVSQGSSWIRCCLTHFCHVLLLSLRCFLLSFIRDVSVRRVWTWLAWHVRCVDDRNQMY